MRALRNFLLQFVVVAFVAAVGSTAVAAVDGNPWLTLVLGLATAAVAVLAYAWVVRRTERRSPDEVGRAGAVSALVRGLLIGVAMFGAVIGNLAFLEYYRIDGLGSPEGAAALFGFMAAAAVSEELLYRGILFRTLEQFLGTWATLVLTALVFGAMHLTNANATPLGVVAVALAGGGMLASAYVATRRLWLPIGLHFGWNFAAGGIFSTEVSGNDTRQGLVDSVTSGPAWLTGGDFGPEASPYTVVFGLLVTVAFLWLAHRRGNLVPFRRRAERKTPTASLNP